MAAQPPTTGPADIPDWPALVSGGLARKGITAADLARRLNRTDADKSRISAWINKGALPSAEVAVLTARLLEIPFSLALRAAGHTATASLVEEIATADEGGAALEVRIAEVREITRGLSPVQQAGLIRRHLERAADALTLTRVEADRLRSARGDQDDDGTRNIV